MRLAIAVVSMVAGAANAAMACGGNSTDDLCTDTFDASVDTATSCMTDVDCPDPACGGEVCAATGPMAGACVPSYYAPNYGDRCNSDTDCKCHFDDGATCELSTHRCTSVVFSCCDDNWVYDAPANPPSDMAATVDMPAPKGSASTGCAMSGNAADPAATLALIAAVALSTRRR